MPNDLRKPLFNMCSEMETLCLNVLCKIQIMRRTHETFEALFIFTASQRLFAVNQTHVCHRRPVQVIILLT